MGAAISEVLPFAIGVAISPVPIIAVILVLFSARARSNGAAFLAGWVVGVALVSVVVYTLADASDAGGDDSASDVTFWINLLLGLALILLAVRSWRHQPVAGQQPKPPRWMESINSLSPLKAGGLALALSSVNPKNLALSLAAGAGLAQAGLTGADAAVGLIVFVLVASTSIAVPVVVFLTGGDRAARMLDSWKAWLSLHNAAVMAVLLLVFGVVSFSKGLRGLTA